MAFPTVLMAIAKVVMDAKLIVVDELIVFLESKIEIDDDLKAMFAEFKDNMKESEEKVVKAAGKKSKKSKKSASSDSDTEKKKRQPSVFNLYVKDTMPDIKLANPDIKDGKKLISFAAESWKNEPKAEFIKSKVLELKALDSEANVIDLYATAKALWLSGDKTITIVQEEKEKEKIVKEKVVKEKVVKEKVVKEKVVVDKEKKEKKDKVKNVPKPPVVESEEIENDDDDEIEEGVESE